MIIKKVILHIMRLFYLGDIHGGFNLISNYIDKFGIKDAHIIQVGDFGVGFKTLIKEKRELEMYHTKLVKNNVTVWAIRGNHDFKPYFDNDPFELSNIKLIPDYTVLELCGKRILCVGGAVSVDRLPRMSSKQGDIFEKAGSWEGFEYTGKESWWNDEVFVLDVEKVGSMKEIDIVVTHTAPGYCPPDNSVNFGNIVESFAHYDKRLKTDLMYERQQMSELFHLLRLNGNYPTKHYYGHFHFNDKTVFEGCEHRVLGVGELWEEDLDEISF